MLATAPRCALARVAAPDSTGLLIYSSDEVARSVGKALTEAHARFHDLLASDCRTKANALTSNFD